MVVTTHGKSVEPESEEADGLATRGQMLHVICLSSQSWQVDLPTNRQQVMARVAQRGHRVLYVETEAFIGRHIASLLRSGERLSLLRQLTATERVSRGIRVMKAPALFPWGHRFRRAARINSALTGWVVRRRMRAYGHAPVLWLYDPCFADCIGKSGEQFAVYDCVDDYAEQVGSDPRRRSLVSEYDALAASRARLVFATTRSLAERHLEHNAQTQLVRNVGDFSHFAPAADRSLAARELAPVQWPVIGFAGSLSAQKVDFELLEAIASRRPKWTVLLIGPVYDATKPTVERIAARETVRWLGPVPYVDLPRYIAWFDVAVIPYVTNSYTRSCFPLKTFEYLAAGKPVVASGVPELAGMEPHVVLTDGADAFIAAIEDALQRSSPSDVATRQALAAANTWETRTSRLLELVAAEL